MASGHVCVSSSHCARAILILAGLGCVSKVTVEARRSLPPWFLHPTLSFSLSSSLASLGGEF